MGYCPVSASGFGGACDDSDSPDILGVALNVYFAFVKVYVFPLESCQLTFANTCLQQCDNGGSDSDIVIV